MTKGRLKGLALMFIQIYVDIDPKEVVWRYFIKKSNLNRTRISACYAGKILVLGLLGSGILGNRSSSISAEAYSIGFGLACCKPARLPRNIGDS